jgi:hypothetical protein
MDDFGEVNGILVSGAEKQLQLFHLTVFMTLNAIDRRGQTVRYTVFDKHLEQALKSAQDNDLTVQRIDRDGHGNETYTLLVKGQHEGWKT